MRVVDRLAQREGTWLELDDLLRRLEGVLPAPRRPPARSRAEVVWIDEADLAPAAGRPPAPPPRPPARRRGRLDPDEILRVGELYRAACADLMLAEAYDLPRETVAYLHDLVARGHNAIYRGRGFRVRGWLRELLAEVPRRLRADPALRVASLAFWGCFVVAGLLAAARPEFARKVAGEAFLEQLEQMYAQPVSAYAKRSDAFMAGFYIQHNAGIGLSCFAWGLSFGVMTLYILVSNALILGTAFGHMARSPNWANFYTFVTAHGPFELTAIVFSGAAGLRLGYGLIDTKGESRLASLRREAVGALPTVGAAVFLFILAAFLEGFVSASTLPYYAKAGIAIASALTLALYLALGGRGRPADEGAVAR